MRKNGILFKQFREDKNLIETFCIVNFIVTFARQYVDFI